MLLDPERYAKFMNLIRLNATEMPVPSLDIDLFWHTHQLAPSKYLPWGNHHIGFPVILECTISFGLLSTSKPFIFITRTCEAMQLYDKCQLCDLEDDRVGARDPNAGLARTSSAWQAIYSEDYLNPSSNDHRRPHPNSCLKLPQAASNTNRLTQAGPSTPVQQPLAHRPMSPAQAGPSRPRKIQPSLTTADKNLSQASLLHSWTSGTLISNIKKHINKPTTASVNLTPNSHCSTTKSRPSVRHRAVS
jgi:hypothetical protein